MSDTFKPTIRVDKRITVFIEPHEMLTFNRAAAIAMRDLLNEQFPLEATSD